MADSVEFSGWVCHDDRPTLSQEDAIARVLAFAGVHDVDALDALGETFSGDLSDLDFADNEQGTWVTTGGKLQGAGGAGAGVWSKILHSTEVELGFVAEFDKFDDRGGFLFCAEYPWDGYIVWWESDSVGLSTFGTTSETKILDLPMTETGDASVRVAVWPLRYTSVDEVDDLLISLWFDGRMLFSHVIDYQEKGKQIGFAAYGSDTVSFDDLRVPQLHQVIEWTSVDPGESASSSLARVKAYEPIRLLARYDGAVKVWRNAGSDVDWTVASGRNNNQIRRTQFYWPTHFRLVGAVHENDGFRDGDQGHIFDLGSDPNALSEDETDARAGRRHRQLEEAATTETIVTPPNPVLEPEDVVELPDGTKWRVTSFNYRAMWREGAEGAAPVLESTIDMRECLDD